MQTVRLIAAAVVMAVVSLPAAVLAQGADDAKGGDKATSQPASSDSGDRQARDAKPKAEAKTESKTEPRSEAKANTKANAKPKAKPQTMTRRQEIEHSIESRTVPARYRSRVPKEYQHYIPFAK